MTSSIRLGVIGMPIEHSLSPRIHTQFAAQFSHNIEYKKYAVEPGGLQFFIDKFFNEGGHGLNVTLPHKSAVAKLVDDLTPEAQITNSVNTLFKGKDGQLVGDTTDGKGLLLDLNKQQYLVNNKRILIVGAGGAAASIIASLLGAGAKISIYNRTVEKAQKLVESFSCFGEVDIANGEHQFDGIISSISSFNRSVFENFIVYLRPHGFCYDLNYSERALDLKNFISENSKIQYSDGLGMLLGQAAYSYKHWTGKMPSIAKVNL